MVSDFAAATRTVACPYCDAEVSEPCRTLSGRWSVSHTARDRLIRDAFFIGVTAGLNDALLIGDWERVEEHRGFMARRWS